MACFPSLVRNLSSHPPLSYLASLPHSWFPLCPSPFSILFQNKNLLPSLKCSDPFQSSPFPQDRGGLLRQNCQVPPWHPLPQSDSGSFPSPAEALVAPCPRKDASPRMPCPLGLTPDSLPWVPAELDSPARTPVTTALAAALSGGRQSMTSRL